jgi:hypothetical protein
MIAATIPAEAIINAACQTDLPCVIRAHVDLRDSPNGMPPTWNVTQVYSARASVPLPRKRRP